jgi:hypothetical protein
VVGGDEERRYKAVKEEMNDEGRRKWWEEEFCSCSAQGRKDSSAWTGSAWSVRMRGSGGITIITMERLSLSRLLLIALIIITVRIGKKNEVFEQLFFCSVV